MILEIPKDPKVKMKIRGVMARKGNTPGYVRRMQQELFEVLTHARGKAELHIVEPLAQAIRDRYMQELVGADVKDLAIHRRSSRVSYSRRCAEASAVKAYQKRGLSLVPGMEIRYVVRDAKKWEVDTEKDASEFDARYYGKLLEKAWDELAFVLQCDLLN
jgi:DNA polymerase, archaea type